MPPDATAATVTAALRRTFTGPVHLPTDDTYDAERLPWNRRVDPRPAIVAQASGADDVRTAILTAREHGLPLAVQSTGHGTIVPADGGLLLKLSRLTTVSVDPEKRTATIGAGALWTDVIAEAAKYDLAPLSGTPSIGVVGYTLGGGIGWLSRKYGYAAESLISAELVTADGRIVTASADENPDLHWGLRGGSGNFGVVLSLEVRLYPVGQVYAGMTFYDIESAPVLLDQYDRWSKKEPDDLHTAVMLLNMPGIPQVPEPIRGKRVVAVRAFYDGSAEDADKLLAPLLSVAGTPLLAGFGTMSFTDAGNNLAPPPPPMTNRQHIDLFRELSGGLVRTLLDAAGPGATSPLAAIEVRHWGGAMARTTADSGPAGHPDIPLSVIATTIMDGQPDREAAEAYVDGLVDRLANYATGGTFLNFVNDPTRTKTAFTPENYARLAQVKRAWDPDNVFRLNHNIEPA